eukprot:scaffold380030_cov16-Prasinocladus_malaysianus.AAC.1
MTSTTRRPRLCGHCGHNGQVLALASVAACLEVDAIRDPKVVPTDSLQDRQAKGLKIDGAKSLVCGGKKSVPVPDDDYTRPEGSRAANRRSNTRAVGDNTNSKLLCKWTPMEI